MSGECQRRAAPHD